MHVTYENEKFIYGILGCIFLSLCIFVPLFEKIIFSSPPTTTSLDYLQHIKDAEHLFNSKLTNPHFLFHLSILFVQKIFFLININIDLRISTIIVMVFCEASSCLILYCFLYRLYREFSIFFVSFIFIVVAPNYLLHRIDNFYLIGYLHPNPIHNPTTIILKPFALLLFVLTERIFFSKQTSIFLDILFFTLIIVSALAKPSYIVIMLPSLVLLTFLYYNRINKYNIVISCGLCFIIIVYTYAVVYMYSDPSASSSGVLLTLNKPFLVIHHFTPNYFLIFSKFFFSLFFPIYVLSTCYKECIKDIFFVYSATLMFFALLLFGFFVESGDRMTHGNFGWSCVIANFLFFIASFKVFFQKYKTNPQPFLAKLGYFIFSVHALCGLAYYLRIFQGRGFS